MRYYILLIFYSLSIYSQEFKIPRFQFMETFEIFDGINPYAKSLNLNDKNSLIIKSSSSSYWFGGEYIDFLVFQNDGKIFKYGMFVTSNNDKSKIKSKEIKRNKIKIIYYKYLEDLFLNNKLDINKELLKIKEKPNENGTVSTMTISDSVNEYYEITQGNQTTYFSFYSVHSYINENYPGIEDKKKFANLISNFEKLINEN